MFLLLYGQPGLTVARMREHMESAGWPQVPEWVTKPEAQGHLTKAGAQSWLRHLFALEIPYLLTHAISFAARDRISAIAAWNRHNAPGAPHSLPEESTPQNSD